MKKNIVMSLVGTALVAAGMVVENKFGVVNKIGTWCNSKFTKKSEQTEEPTEPEATEEK